MQRNATPITTNGNGSRWASEARQFIRENWFIVMAMIAMLTWGIRVESRTTDSFTRSEARALEAEISLKTEQSIGQIRSDISRIREDIAFIRGKYESESANNRNKARGQTP